MSAGIAVFPGDGESVTAIIAPADQALDPSTLSTTAGRADRYGATHGQPILPGTTGDLPVQVG